MDKPVKIDDDLTITMKNGKALIASRIGLPPAIVQDKLQSWFENNSGHPRSGDVLDWLENYKAQYPPTAKPKPISEVQREIAMERARLLNRWVKHYSKTMPEELAQKKLLKTLFDIDPEDT
jgi:hypothetical protein